MEAFHLFCEERMRLSSEINKLSAGKDNFDSNEQLIDLILLNVQTIVDKINNNNLNCNGLSILVKKAKRKFKNVSNECFINLFYNKCMFYIDLLFYRNELINMEYYNIISPNVRNLLYSNIKFENKPILMSWVIGMIFSKTANNKVLYKALAKLILDQFNVIKYKLLIDINYLDSSTDYYNIVENYCDYAACFTCVRLKHAL